MTDDRFQIILWPPRWCGFCFVKLNPLETDMALIYTWVLCVGFLEVRKWATPDWKETRRSH